MRNSRTMTRTLSLGLSALMLAACGDDGNNVTTSGQTDGTTSDDTTGDSSTPTTTTNDPTGQSASETSDEPTGGSESMTGDGTSTGDGTDTQSSETSDETTGSTGAIDPVCGNGVQEGNEECDDGNDVPDDGCEPGCVNTPVCGNEIIETGEACDDGNTEDGDMCSADCTMMTVEAVCGNGDLERGESCDDGNVEDGDGCQADCTPTPAECGNMQVEGDEECDDGNDVNGGVNDFCKNDCTVFTPPQCQAPPEYVNCDDNINLADKADKTNALKAIGICNAEPNNSIITTDYVFESSNNAAWQVAKGFGTHMIDHDGDPNTPMQLIYSPREGSTFLMMSSGVIKAPDNQGIVIEGVNSQVNNGENNNHDANALPAPFRFEQGSNNGAGGTPFLQCDGIKDCSDSLQAQWILGDQDPNDRIFFTFKTKVPAGTFGYSFDFVFCSAEWPTYVNTGFNDMLIAYQVDPAADDPNADPPIDPYTGNVTFIPDPNDNTKGLPLTITALDPYFDGPGYTFNEEPLKGTGFEQHACTDWFTAKGGVQPGSDVTIGFFLADMSDSILATGVLLDNFRWDCEGCIPSEVDDCGVQDPQ